MTSLDERVAAAFADGASSSWVVDLIAEVEAASAASGEAADVARTRALDPTLAAVDVAAARRALEDATFQRDRLNEAVRRLGERLREVKAQEEHARRRAAYDAALAERDQLAAELAEVYPPLAEKLADLASRIARNDTEVERVNRRLPDGATWLADAEMIAREVRSFNDVSANIPRITARLRLPAFRYSGLDPYIWPSSKRSSDSSMHESALPAKAAV
jgi:chromosome segregation ATPase